MPPSLYITFAITHANRERVRKPMQETWSWGMLPLSSDRTAGLRHGGVLLLEPVAQSLRALHLLVDTSHDAAFFAGTEGLALEAVDAVVEAALDEVGVHLATMISICWDKTSRLVQ
jgi:hypothetical protein